MAQEASDLTRNLNIGQAGAAVLAQANQKGKTALRLIGAGKR